MGASAIRSLIEREAPYDSGFVMLNPSTPEEIEPVLGILPCQFELKPIWPYTGSERLHPKGPWVNSFWVGRTLNGEAGRLPRGLKHSQDNDYCVTFAGDLAVKAIVRRNVFDIIGVGVSSGLVRQEGDERAVINNPESVRRLLARGVFYMLNPSEHPASTNFHEITRKSMSDMREARETRDARRMRDKSLPALKN